MNKPFRKQGGKLTSKQQRFIDEYLIDLNGTAAVIRAGYAPKTAATMALKRFWRK